MNNEGYVICEECSGTGEICTNNGLTKRICYHCYGSGKLTWIENILGKHETNTLEAECSVSDHANKNCKGSISWCINNLKEGGVLKLKPGIYDLSASGTIVIKKNITFEANNVILTNGVIKTNKTVNYALNISPDSRDFTISNMHIFT
jgi:RecJ-like exonuclease